jgi:hypothetical protein
MFDINGNGIIVWEEIHQLLDVLLLPSIPIYLLKEWAFVRNSNAEGLTYSEWNSLITNGQFRNYVDANITSKNQGFDRVASLSSALKLMIVRDIRYILFL